MEPKSNGDDGPRLRRMRRARVAAFGATGAAAAAAVVGLAVPAGASPMTPPLPVAGIEHFQIIGTTPGATTASVIAWGAFTAAGVDNGVTGTADQFVFPNGSFTVTHGNLQGGSFDPKTCLFQFNTTGSYTLANGTGAYQGISGKGTFTLSEIGIGARTTGGACDQTANLVAVQLLVDAAGPVRVP
jgi:hypothetical protein